MPDTDRAVYGYTLSGTLLNSDNTRYAGPFLSSGIAAGDSHRTPITLAGTLKNMYFRVRLNNLNANGTVTLMLNGSASALVITVTASTAGLFSDTTNTVAVVAGDLISFKFDDGGATAGAWTDFSIVVECQYV